MTLPLVLNLFGLGLTVIGALAAAKGVMITEGQAHDLAAPKWDRNEELAAALLRQSKWARDGLLFVSGGTFLQAVALLVAR